MQGKLTSQSYEELFAGLSDAATWFRELRLPTENNRFAAILDNVKLVRQHYDKPSLDDVIRDHPIPELLISLLDAGAFITVHQQLRCLNSSQLPRGRLKEILSGPLLPHDEGEDGQTIQARDALFELELAAFLLSKGIKVVRFDDIEFKFDGVTVNIQCKRLHSSTSLQGNLTKACEQVAKRMDSGTKRGIVAIALDKVSGVERSLLPMQDEATLAVTTGVLMDEFMRQNQYTFNAISDVRILGVMAELRYAAKVGSHGNLLTRGHERGFYSLCSEIGPRAADKGFVERLGSRIAESVEWL